MAETGVGAGELRASEELNQRILEAVPGGIVHVASDGTILRANAEALRVLGLSYDQLTQKYTTDFESETVWEDGSACAAADYPVSRALRTGQPQPSAMIGVRRPDGQVSWAIFTAVPVLAADGSVTGAVATFLDITARRRAEEALRESETWMRSLLESAPGIILHIDREQRVLFINRSVAGARTEDVIGRFVTEMVREGDQERVRGVVQSVLDTGVPASYEARGPRAYGDPVYLVHVGAARSGDEIRGATLVATDITEQKQMEGRLLLSDRLTAVGTLAAGVAHEINNPLTYVLANLEWIAAESDSKIATKKRAADALDGATRIRDVVRDLMSFSHRDDGAPGPVALKDVIERAARVASHQLATRARFVFDYEVVPPVQGQPSRLGQVFLNLLINAAHAIPPGDVEGNEIRVATRVLHEGMVRCSVSDTGSGIERSLLGHIFDPFVTTKPVGEGTGLGLYTCHNIVKSLGGAIWVESEVQRGTTFHVDLPVHTRASSPAPSPAVRPSSVVKGLHILVIDDEPSIAAYLKHALSEHQVATAGSGEEAMAALDALKFDVVLCDLIMPGVTGMDLHDHTLRTNPALAKRFVFMTGAVFTERAQLLVGSTPNPVIYKPFGIPDVLGAIQQVMAEPTCT